MSPTTTEFSFDKAADGELSTGGSREQEVDQLGAGVTRNGESRAYFKNFAEMAEKVSRWLYPPDASNTEPGPTSPQSQRRQTRVYET